MLELYGGGFRLPPASYPGLDPSGVTPRTVSVRFGTAELEHVAVVRSNLLRVISPPSPIVVGPGGVGSEGLVDVRVANLDDAGDEIPGESVIVVDGFRYQRPRLDDETMQVLVQAERALLVAMRRGVLDNTMSFSSVDFDSDVTDGTVDIAKFPALGLQGPRLARRREQDGEQVIAPEHVLGAPQEELSAIMRAPFVVDLVWDLVGLVGPCGPTGPAGGKTQLLSLIEATINFVHRTPFLTIFRDPTDTGAGTLRLDFGFASGGEPRAERSASESDLLQFNAELRLAALPLLGWAGVFGDAMLDVVPELLYPEVAALQLP